jgi:hypothetical protein
VDLLDEQSIAHGSRELFSDQRDCSEIFDAVALAIAIALDSASTSDRSSEPLEAPAELLRAQSLPAPPAAASPAALPPTTPDMSSESQVPASRTGSTPRLHIDMGLEAEGSLGVVPSATAGLSAFARGRVTSWSLAVEIRADLPESMARSDALGGGRVEAWLAAVGLAPCVHAGYVLACVVGALGSLQASGRDIDPQLSKTAPFVAAGLRLGVEWPESTMFALRVRADGLANLRRARLTLGQSDEVWGAPPFAGTLGVGVVARFP